MSTEQMSILGDAGVDVTLDGFQTERVMHCLWNGEYGDHDLGHINGLDWILNNQKNIYGRYIGVTVGDFKCIDVEYDWGRRDQRWTVECVLCGERTYKYNTSDWRRGKGGRTACHCRKDREQEEINKRKAEREKRINDEIGKVYENYEVVQYTGYSLCTVKCLKCGAIRKERKLSDIKSGVFPSCNCNIRKYDYKQMIGKRKWHLTVIKEEGQYFTCKCDCGREIDIQKWRFASGNRKTCRNPECKYISEEIREQQKAAINGLTYEALSRCIISACGYKVHKLPYSGDFGVDFIAIDKDGTRIAVQSKSKGSSKPIGVKAVQEVYAGGRYYDLEHFAIISESEYSEPAIKMAKKLGVYLCSGVDFKYPEDMKKYANSLISTVRVKKRVKRQKLYEINGEEKTLANIAFEYGTSEYMIKKGLERGLTIENAINYRPREKKQYTVQGITGTLKELCEHFGVVSSGCAQYRINNGMNIEDAVLTEKLQQGRPKKDKQKYGQVSLFK